jgi:hypothetical protein
MRENIYIERMFSLPNDKLGAYRNVVNHGIFNFNDKKAHNVSVVVSDVSNNKSILRFKVKSYDINAPEIRNEPEKDNLRVMPYEKTNRFIANDISVSIPGGALYDTLYFDYKREKGSGTMLSDVHMVHNKYTPLHKPFKLAIKPQRTISGKESKMLIALINGNMSRTPLNSEWEDGYLTAEAKSFGNYCICIDTVPPVISARSLSQGINLSGKNEINIRISDDFSGIKSYEPYIDGKWALFEYDAKYDLLTYRFDPERIKKGIKHNLELVVTDNKNNTSRYSCDFTW